jgi:hypothetical protein
MGFISDIAVIALLIALGRGIEIAAERLSRWRRARQTQTR